MTQASCHPVIPSACRCCCATSRARRHSAWSVGGTNRSRNEYAAPSCSVPVGSPVTASRSMRPSHGSGVSLVIPATSSARLFTHAPCTSLFIRNTGRSATMRSRSSLCGAPPGNRYIAHPPPVIRASPGFATPPHGAGDASPGRPATVPTWSRFTRSRFRPPNAGWTWASWNPGTTSRPGSDRTSVVRPASSRSSSGAPIATIRPSFTATAPGRGPTAAPA